METLIPVASIVMAGVFLTVIAWQVLSIGKTAMLNKAGRNNEEIEELRERVQALESQLNKTV